MSKQVNKKKTTLVRIDSKLHHELKIEAARRGSTMRTLLEEGLSEVLSINISMRKVGRYD